MHVLLSALVIAVAVTCTVSAQGEQQSEALEQEIRKLEMRDADAVLRGDFTLMERTWSDDFTVNSPRNRVTKGKREVLDLIRAGNIGTYAAFERQIESVTIHADVAVVMGMEIVKRTSKAAPTGEAVRRRYMNVWTKRQGEWLLTARQANVVCEN